MRIDIYNDTGRVIGVHPATHIHGCTGSEADIHPLETRRFELPDECYPWVKLWDYGEAGLHMLVSATPLDKANPLWVVNESLRARVAQLEEEVEMLKKVLEVRK